LSLSKRRGALDWGAFPAIGEGTTAKDALLIATNRIVGREAHAYFNAAMAGNTARALPDIQISSAPYRQKGVKRPLPALKEPLCEAKV